jgi:hypothetical protein
LIINRASSPTTVTRPSCRQCDSPAWSHTAFLSWFHARGRSPFRLHNRRIRLLGGSPVESLQSHMILTMSHWSSGLPVCFPPQGTQVQIPWGDLCETGILLLALSRYTRKSRHLSQIYDKGFDTRSSSMRSKYRSPVYHKTIETGNHWLLETASLN